MKLLTICPYYPPHIGGLENHAAEFNQQFAARGYDITVFTPQLPQTTPQKETQPIPHTTYYLQVIRFPAFEVIPNYPIPKFWLPLFWKQWNDAQRSLNSPIDVSIQPVVILSRTRFFLTSLAAWYLARRHHFPWLHVEHGSDYPQIAGSFAALIARTYDNTVGRYVLQRADMVVANSRATAEFIKLLSGRVCPVIYRGVKKDEIIGAEPDKTAIIRKGSRTVIAFSGRLIAGKGVIHLLRAFEALCKENLLLYIIGSGPQESDLRSYVNDSKIANKVIFWGVQPWERAISILKTSDIFVNPSYTEGIPASVIEAAHCNLAIIATDVGGTREIITHEESGLLVPPHDQAQLTQALKRLVSDIPLRIRLADQAYARVLTKFSWKRSADQYEKVIQGLV